jgi:LPPG:FO 2-phospho-L-lactate transferase
MTVVSELGTPAIRCSGAGETAVRTTTGGGSGTGGVVLLTGGLGGARLAAALARALAPRDLTVVVNVGDDLDWHGLRVCPDLDTVLYSLADQLDRERGWGRAGDTFTVADTLGTLGEPAWFGIGDRDLALHLVRADRLRAGQSLTEVTGDLARRLGVVRPAVLPASDGPCPTVVVLEDGRAVGFQEWYVGMRAEPPVRDVAFGAGAAAPAALDALDGAAAVVLGPSSPVASIGTILSLDGMAEAVAAVPRRVAVSPTVGTHEPLSGSVAHHALARRQLLAARGGVDTPSGVAAHYVRHHPGLVDLYLIDERDRDQVTEIERAGLRLRFAPLLDAEGLAETLARLVG